MGLRHLALGITGNYRAPCNLCLERRVLAVARQTLRRGRGVTPPREDRSS
jgi:hypothetical protein